MPNSPAARMIARADSAPWRWPSMRGNPRCLAQRPLPSMITATCWGREALASGERWETALLISKALEAIEPVGAGQRHAHFVVQVGEIQNRCRGHVGPVG